MDIVVKVSTLLPQLKKGLDIENRIRIKKGQILFFLQFGNVYKAKAVLLS